VYQNLPVRLTEHEARERLASVPVVRLGTADADGRPHLVPITFAVDGDQIYTAVDHKPKRSRDLKRLHNIREDPQVAVLADHYDDDWARLWWVRCDGRATVLTGDSAMSGPVRLLVDRYEQYRQTPPAGPVIMISVERWTGWSALPRRMVSTAGPTRPIRAPGETFATSAAVSQGSCLMCFQPYLSDCFPSAAAALSRVLSFQ
jgi:PPOX class probable F420-dependent enzyme